MGYFKVVFKYGLLLIILLFSSCTKSNISYPKPRNDGVQDATLQVVMDDTLRSKIKNRAKFIIDSLGIECNYISDYPQRYKHVGSYEIAVFCNKEYHIRHDYAFRGIFDNTFKLPPGGYYFADRQYVVFDSTLSLIRIRKVTIEKNKKNKNFKKI